jgi:hypothetical protein
MSVYLFFILVVRDECGEPMRMIPGRQVISELPELLRSFRAVGSLGEDRIIGPPRVIDLSSLL